MKYYEENEVFLSKWLNGEVTDEEVKSSIGDEEFEIYQKLIKRVDQLGLEEYDSQGQYNAVKERIRMAKIQKPRILSIRRLLPYVAAAASVLLIVVFYFLFPLTDEGHYLTGIGEQQTVVLPDGSEVILNANSTMDMELDNWDQIRQVKLEGEAFFNVKKGTQFQVITDHLAVKVLGTSFNVKDRENGLAVACFTGKVSVYNLRKTAGNDILLSAGEGVLITGKNEQELWDFNPMDGPSWKNGITRFNATPLRVVLAEFTNHYPIEFQYHQLPVDSLFTGSFVHGDLESALDMVFGAMEIDYIVSKKNTVVLIQQ